MIRMMEAADVPEVEMVERLCFSEPWTAAVLSQGLACPLDVYLALEEEGQIFGYCALRIIGEEAELQRIAVLPQKRRQGCAKKLMDTVTAFAKNQGVSAMTLEVRSRNEAAINLYKSYGFCEEALRRGYYRNPPDDAVLMWNRRI